LVCVEYEIEKGTLKQWDALHGWLTFLFPAFHIDMMQRVYTGPIDTYFSKQGWPALEYRSLDFERKVALNTEFFQPNSVVNHPSSEDDFTRIVEYKHFLKQRSPHTVYYVERSKDGGEPYYPVPNKRNKDLFAKYQKMADNEDGVYFVGRLANYKYFNMDEAILNALELFDKVSSASS
jgi:UDP-galactopyranose mutase